MERQLAVKGRGKVECAAVCPRLGRNTQHPNQKIRTCVRHEYGRGSPKNSLHFNLSGTWLYQESSPLKRTKLPKVHKARQHRQKGHHAQYKPNLLHRTLNRPTPVACLLDRAFPAGLLPETHARPADREIRLRTTLYMRSLSS